MVEALENLVLLRREPVEENCVNKYATLAKRRQYRWTVPKEGCRAYAPQKFAHFWKRQEL